MINRILVVDDEPASLESIRRGLLMSGFKNIRTVSDPREALALLERGGSFDVALLDIRMPFIDGLELLDIFKKISPTTKCIMMSALHESEIVKTALEKGAFAYLTKPFGKETLVSLVNRALTTGDVLNLLT